MIWSKTVGIQSLFSWSPSAAPPPQGHSTLPQMDSVLSCGQGQWMPCPMRACRLRSKQRRGCEKMTEEYNGNLLFLTSVPWSLGGGHWADCWVNLLWNAEWGKDDLICHTLTHWGCMSCRVRKTYAGHHYEVTVWPGSLCSFSGLTFCISVSKQGEKQLGWHEWNTAPRLQDRS